jgi:hypothetical protein
VKKIPTLFVRDPANPSRITRDYHPDCLWVRDGKGIATRKYDGTCVLFDGAKWWTRREVKGGREAPRDYWPVQYNRQTGKTVGWEPAEQSPFAQYLAEATSGAPVWVGGTYELIGPKINGNPDCALLHTLILHSGAQQLENVLREYDALGDYLSARPIEGIVWHAPDGRMAKIKRRDFGLPWPPR